MTDTRLLKAVRDLWFDRGRTIIVILAIAIGIFAAGTVLAGYSILDRELNANYMDTNPPSAILWTDNVNASLIRDVKDTGLVIDAGARRMVTGRVQTGPDQWRAAWLFVVDDYDRMNIATVHSEEGAWPPKRGEVLIERAAMPLISAGIGDNLTVKTPVGTATELKVTGTAHDPAQAPAVMEGLIYGYITTDTLADLGVAPTLNQLLITVASNATDEEYIKTVSYKIKDTIGQSGRTVTRIEVPAPGKHPHAGQMGSLLFLFEAFGALTFLLSLILVVNMITGLISRQIRQIGIMKSLGATTAQIMGIYLGSAFILGLIATVIALPLSILAGCGMSVLVAGMLNFDIGSFDISHWVYALVIGLGLLMPIAAAAYPVYRGSRITVHEALNDYGISADGKKKAGFVDSIASRIPGISRPLMLSVRNTFRKTGRLILTLLTLAIGGALFIVAMNLSASMDTTVDNALDARHYSSIIAFAGDYPGSAIESNLTSVSGVKDAERLISDTASLTEADGTDSNEFSLFAISPDSKMVTYPVLEGRWLQPGDKNAIVLNHMLVAELEEHDYGQDIKPGDSVTLNLKGQRSEWKVAGIVREMLAPARAYVSYDYYAPATGRDGMANAAVIMASETNASAPATGGLTIHGMTIGGTKVEQNPDLILPAIERQMSNSGMKVSNLASITEMRLRMKEHLAVIVAFVTFMAAMAITVGMLGLATTMVINILERQREFGVMRAIGATGRNIYRMIGVEALVIGLISWLVAIVLAPPLSMAIGTFFGLIFFKSPLDLAMSHMGMALWLVIIMILSPAASLLAARKASTLPVHEVLAYE